MNLDTTYWPVLDPFLSNGIFHKVWYNKVKMDCCIFWDVAGYIIGLDKQKIQRKIVNIFLPMICSICFGCSKNRLIEMVLLSTHNICFCWEIKKLFFCYTLLTKVLLYFPNNIVFLSLKIIFVLANSADPDDMPKYYDMSSWSALFVKGPLYGYAVFL